MDVAEGGPPNPSQKSIRQPRAEPVPLGKQRNGGGKGGKGRGKGGGRGRGSSTSGGRGGNNEAASTDSEPAVPGLPPPHPATNGVKGTQGSPETTGDATATLMAILGMPSPQVTRAPTEGSGPPQAAKGAQKKATAPSAGAMAAMQRAAQAAAATVDVGAPDVPPTSENASPRQQKPRQPTKKQPPPQPQNQGKDKPTGVQQQQQQQKEAPRQSHQEGTREPRQPAAPINSTPLVSAGALAAMQRASTAAGSANGPIAQEAGAVGVPLTAGRGTGGRGGGGGRGGAGGRGGVAGSGGPGGKGGGGRGRAVAVGSVGGHDEDLAVEKADKKASPRKGGKGAKGGGARGGTTAPDTSADEALARRLAAEEEEAAGGGGSDAPGDAAALARALAAADAVEAKRMAEVEAAKEAAAKEAAKAIAAERAAKREADKKARADKKAKAEAKQREEEERRAAEAAAAEAEAARKAQEERAAAEAARQKALKSKIGRAGTAYAALLMDESEDDEDDDDEGSSATDDDDDDKGSAPAPPPPPPTRSGRKAGSAPPPKAPATPPKKPPALSGTATATLFLPDSPEPQMYTAPTAAAAPAAPPEPEPEPEPLVFWGSEEHDPAQRLPISVTIAHYTKVGEHKMHANEDRYAVHADLNAELAARKHGAAAKKRNPADAASTTTLEALEALCLDEGGGAPDGSTPPPNVFFGVYDGHGGSSTAQHLANRLHVLLAADSSVWRDAPREALINAFALCEGELRRNYEAHPDDKSGSCACVGLLRGRRLLIASAGDCRALLVRAEGTPTPLVQMTRDHRATEPREQKRILKEGGQIKDGRVWGALMPSRTLGDFPWKDKGPGLSPEPEIFECEVGPDDRYIVVGSDGLFDVLSNKTIGRIGGKMSSSAQKVCNELQKELRKKPTGDDTTMVVVQLVCG